MSYLALYRKYRPSTFDEVKGQDHIVTTLKNQLKTGRVGHAYLFCGTRGTGKTSIAKIFAKAVNCESPVEGSPCGKCNVCKSIEDGSFMNVIEIDAASNNGVDSVRQIVDEIKYSPSEGKYRVYIIDEVHMLSTGAFNALLKTLEEPPSYVIFILATTEAHKIPITILSRCQKYSFRRISVETIAEHLGSILKSEGIEAEEKALQYVARLADGSMRDAESLLDQCIAFYLGQDLTYEKVLQILGGLDNETYAGLLRYIVKNDVARALGVFDEAMIEGKDSARFVTEFITYIRNVLIVKTTPRPERVLEYSNEQIELLRNEARHYEVSTIIKYINSLSELSNKLRFATQKRVLTEVEIIKLCVPETERNDGAVLERVRKLEMRLEEIAQNGVVRVHENMTLPETQKDDREDEEEIPIPVLDEEMKKIGAAWDRIIDVNRGAIIRTELKGVVPTSGADGKLVLNFFEKELPDGTEDIIHNETSGKAFLERLCDIVKESVKSVLNMSVEVTFRVEKERKFQKLKKVDISDLVAAGVPIDTGNG
ncbi:MAG: DNA polymerase III subunit gamma/tau [Lachnospiraceae bacterium]|nr:DNA polymerase III subunit gamma/tau [Lachnospiraceae bacterium]